ncbi:hypothetical protein [Heyndrickxia coagulans]|uniref:hypothetical protein n=1 Tax=Heyndrickxia coagulans TaxID=1398 RepID=UPI0023E3DA0D|nr:hypothetical protein [Heyndrickxia coagulans]
MKNDKKRQYTIHETDVILDKDRLKSILRSKKMEYIELYRRVKVKYGLDIHYKGFMALLDNRSSWKLLYAWAIVDVLDINPEDIFRIIRVDVEEKIKEKEEWNKKYGNKKG